MKLLAALSLLSSPYTWMMPPGRVPSPDVGDVLLAGKTDRRIGPRHFQQAAGVLEAQVGKYPALTSEP